MSDQKISALNPATLPLTGEEMIPLVQGGQTVRTPSSSLQGAQGAAGLSAYEVALTEGFIGSEAEWLASLKGPKGNTGAKGDTGAGLTIKGELATPVELPPTGADGDAYLIAGDLYVWTAGEWANVGNIQGPAGTEGREVQLQKSATHIEWRYAGDTSWTPLVALSDLQGPAGSAGTPGTDGREVQLQKSATHIQWKYAGVATWTNLVPLADLVGAQGTAGADGKNLELQKSATHIQWRVVGATTWVDLIALSELKGDKGDPGVSATAANAGYQVAPVTKAMTGPDGKRFIARGVQMFDYLFVSQETRTDQRYRAIRNPSGKGPGTGISEPTYYAKVCYVSRANVEAQIRLARNNGVNLLRVGVEAAVQLASVAYVDVSDGLTYPSDHEMLDTIIEVAGNYGMVVQLQCSNDLVSTTDNVTFLKWLTARYFTKAHVWINPANEPNGVASGGANVADPTAWTNKIKPLVVALREDVTGQPAGTKFLNPVVIDPPSYAYRLDLIASVLTSDTTFSADPNLVINIHYYPVAGETDFRGTRLTTDLTRWVNYLPNYCIMIGEAGIDNLAGRLDPDLDPGVTSANPTQWAQVQAAVTDFLSWCHEQMQAGILQGAVGHMWFAYIPGMSRHDDNSMRRTDGTWTTWGTIFRDKFLTLRIGSSPNASLAPMAQGLLKGRAATAGTGAPQDLTSLQALAIIANLGTTRVGNAATGTPIFQAEDTAGVRGASMFVGSAANSSYIGFYNRATSTLVGHIMGNGGTGISYGSTSDYRLKERVRPLSNGLEAVLKMKPVMAHWRASPEGDAEPMFLAHELQEVAPIAVTGEKDQVADFEGVETLVAQTVDYGRITPLLVAAIQELTERVQTLERALANKS